MVFYGLSGIKHLLGPLKFVSPDITERKSFGSGYLCEESQLMRS